jgi:hypothetical protein
MLLNTSNPFQRLTICGVFERSLSVLRADAATFATIGVLMAVPSFLFHWLIKSKVSKILADLANVTDPEENSDAMVDALKGMVGPMLVSLILLLVAGTISKVATIRSTVQIYLNQKPALYTDIKHGALLLPRMMCLWTAFYGAAFAVGVVVGISMVVMSVIFSSFLSADEVKAAVVLLNIVFHVAIVYIANCLVFWDIALVVEGLPEFRPFFRSYDMVKRQWWFVFCACFLESIAVLLITLFTHVLLGSLGPWATVIAQTVLGVFLTPFSGVFVTVLYLNSRVTGEGCNAEVLGKDMPPDGHNNGEEAPTCEARYSALLSEDLHVDSAHAASTNKGSYEIVDTKGDDVV